MTLDISFAQLCCAFPRVAAFQGIHLRYAEKNGVCLIERKMHDRFFYKLLWEGNAKIIHASLSSKLTRMRAIGDSFSLSTAYADS